MADSATIPAPAKPSAAGGATAPLDDIMLAMDVVDTMRHADRLVERELSADQREADLKDRLREIYHSQGIEVTDQILQEGVAALREERFAYHPTDPGFKRSLALFWIRRRDWGRPMLAGLLTVLLGLGGYWALWKIPQQQRLAAEQIELSATLPKRFGTEVDRIRAIALDPSAITDAERLQKEGVAAAKSGDLKTSRARADQLTAIRETLEQEYTIRVISYPQQQSGVFRIPRANPNARNFYLIVEAVAPGNKILPILVNSEEDGRAEKVTRWGVRVNQAVYDQIRADKQDDGIIQNNRVGEKRKGYLKPNYVYPSVGGSILDW